MLERLAVNTLAYRVNSKVTKKMKCCECMSWVVFTTLHFLCNLQLVEHTKMLLCNRMERLAGDKHYSLLVSFVGYKENEML